MDGGCSGYLTAVNVDVECQWELEESLARDAREMHRPQWTAELYITRAFIEMMLLGEWLVKVST